MTLKTFISRLFILAVTLWVVIMVSAVLISESQEDPARTRFPQIGFQKVWEVYDSVLPLEKLESYYEKWAKIEDVSKATDGEIAAAILFPSVTLAAIPILLIGILGLLYQLVKWLGTSNPQSVAQPITTQTNRQTAGEVTATPPAGGFQITWPVVGLVALALAIVIGAVLFSRESVWIPQVIHRQAERVGEPMEVLINNRFAIGELRAMAAEIKSGGSISEKELQVALQNASTSLAELEVLQATMTITPTAAISVTAPASISLSTIKAAISETEKVLQQVSDPEELKIQPHRSRWQGIWSWLRWVLLVGVIVLVVGIAFGVIQFQGGPTAPGRFTRIGC